MRALALALPRTRTILLAGAVSLCASTSAFALEGLPLFESLVDQGKAKVTWGSAEERGPASFTLKDVRLVGADGRETAISEFSADALREGEGQTITFDSMVGSGFAFAPTDRGDRVTLDRLSMRDASVPRQVSYGEMEPLDTPGPNVKIGSFELVALAVSGAEYRFDMGGLTVDELDVPSSDKAATNGFLRPYSTASVDGVSFDYAGTRVAGVERLAATVTPAEADGTVKSSTTLTGLEFDLTALPDERSKAIAGQLGYEKIRGQGEAEGSYNPTTGRVTMDKFDLAFEDALDLSMTLVATGYTQQIAQQIQALSARGAGTDAPPPMAEMLPLLQNVMLESANLTLTDRSLTGRLLNFQAGQMGTTAEQLAMSAPLFIGMGLGGLNMPGLTEMVTSAVGTFLREKGALSVTVSPAKPVSVAAIMTSAYTDAKTLPDMLGLTVKAR